MNGKKLGRPKGIIPPKKVISVRLGEDSISKLDNYVKEKNVDRSEAIRRGIDKLEEELK